MNKKIFLALIVVFTAVTAMAQGRLDLRINEVMVENDSNYVDQDGHRSAWIEIFNASHGTNAIEKMFITTLSRAEIKAAFDKEKGTSKKGNQILNEFSENAGKGKVYVIPRGDVDTKIKPRSHAVFFADGNDAAGTFHLPFTIKAGDYVALYDVNGDLVDEVTIPADLPANQSYARKNEEAINLHVRHTSPADDDFANGETLFIDSLWTVRDGSSEETAITPGKFNARPVNENIDTFHNQDGYGFFITLASMGVVFTALLMLYLLFKLFGKAFTGKKEEEMKGEEPHAQAQAVAAQEGSNDEAIAAICMALYQHLNAHDEESGILTFDHTHELHSSWSSKGNLLLPKPEHHDHK